MEYSIWDLRALEYGTQLVKIFSFSNFKKSEISKKAILSKIISYLLVFILPVVVSPNLPLNTFCDIFCLHEHNKKRVHLPTCLQCPVTVTMETQAWHHLDLYHIFKFHTCKIQYATCLTKYDRSRNVLQVSVYHNLRRILLCGGALRGQCFMGFCPSTERLNSVLYNSDDS